MDVRLSFTIHHDELHTHEPANLSMNTLRVKSSIEYAILSRIPEQSGSVASWSSFPDISCKAAERNRRRSKLLHQQ